jgi:hydroxylamine reductase
VRTTSTVEGCQTVGVCGKDEQTTTLQDLLIHAIKGISMYSHRSAKLGVSDAGIDAFTIKAIFATLTNVNFDPERLVKLIYQTVDIRAAARSLYERASACAGFMGRPGQRVRRVPRRDSLPVQSHGPASSISPTRISLR